MLRLVSKKNFTPCTVKVQGVEESFKVKHMTIADNIELMRLLNDFRDGNEDADVPSYYLTVGKMLLCVTDNDNNPMPVFADDQDGNEVELTNLKDKVLALVDGGESELIGALINKVSEVNPPPKLGDTDEKKT